MKSQKKELEKDILKVENLVDKFKFKESIPQEVRAQAISSRKRIFKRIAKTLGILTIGYSIYLSLYFFFKKLGLTKLIVSLFVATSVTTGTVVTIKYIQQQNLVKGVSLQVQPEKLIATESNKIEGIKIITQMSDNSKKDITLQAAYAITPKDLATITKDEKQNSVTLTFAKAGKGVLVISHKDLKTTIEIMHEPKATYNQKLSPLAKLHKQYKHLEKILLADGTVLKGVLIDKGDGTVVFIMPDRKLNLKKSDVVKVEYIRP